MQREVNSDLSKIAVDDCCLSLKAAHLIWPIDMLIKTTCIVKMNVIASSYLVHVSIQYLA